MLALSTVRQPFPRVLPNRFQLAIAACFGFDYDQ
jgi:hypothetical protein